MTKMLQTIWIDECKVRCKGSTFDVKWDSECEDSSSVKTPGDKALLSKNPKPKPRFVETTYIDLYWLFKISESSSNTIQHNLLFHGFSLVFFSFLPKVHGTATPRLGLPCGQLLWRLGAVASQSCEELGLLLPRNLRRGGLEQLRPVMPPFPTVERYVKPFGNHRKMWV